MGGPAAASEGVKASPKKATAKNGVKRSTSTAGSLIAGQGGANANASCGAGYVALHAWIVAACRACDELAHLKKTQFDLELEISDAATESESQSKVCLSLASQLEEAQVELK